MPIKNILVPTDFSENARLALDHAVDLACQLGAKVHVLYVQDESTLRTAVKEGIFRDDSTDAQLEAEIERLTKDRLEKVLVSCATSGVEVERLVKRGEADVVITRFAREINADLVVVGLRGAGLMGLIKSAVLGSVAEAVIKKSPCPVLVVRLEHRQLLEVT